MNSKTTTLRAHHIQTARLIYKTTEEVFTKIGLIKFGYIKNTDNPFKKIAYDDLKNLFENDSNKIRVTEGGLDILCESCPRKEHGKCNPENPRKEHARMTIEFYESPEADREILEKYNLEKNKTYTVKELRAALKF